MTILALACHAREASARWRFYDQHNRLSGAPVWQVVESADGRVWVLDVADNVLGNSLDDWPTLARAGQFHAMTLADDYEQFPTQALASGPDSSLWFPVVLNSGFFPEGDTEAHHFRTAGDSTSGSSQLMRGVALAIAPVHGDTAFVSTSGGLYRLEAYHSGQNLAATPFSPAPPGGWTNPMKIDRDGALWVGASEIGNCGTATPCRGAWLGIARLDGDHWRLFTAADGLAATPVVGLVQSPDGTLWAVHVGNEISRFDGSTWRAMTVPFKGTSTTIAAWAADPKDGIWLAATGALSHLGSDGWRTLGAEEEVPQNQITALNVDHCGQVWLGLDDGRVGRFSDEQRGDPRGPDRVDRLFEDASGTLWSTSIYDSLRSFDGLHWPGRGQGLPAGKGAVFQTRSGVLWAATSSGVRRFDGSIWVDCCAASNSPHLEVQEMSEAPGGDLWFEGSGFVYRFDGAAWTAFQRGVSFDTTPADTFPIPIVPGKKTRWYPFPHPDHRIVADSAGRVWVATPKGCSMYSNGVWRDFRVRDGLDPGAVISLYESPRGDIWASQEGYGSVSRFRGGVWTNYPVQQFGILGFGQRMIFDRAGDPWVLGFSITSERQLLAHYVSDQWIEFDESQLPELAWQCDLGLTPQGALRIASWTSSIAQFPLPNMWTLRYTFWDGQKFVSAAAAPESSFASTLLAQRNGRLWLQDGLGHLSTFDPDQSPPQTVLLGAPARLIAERTPTVTAFATRTEPIGIEYSFALDGHLGRDWSPLSFWQLPSLGDGEHVVEARARDALENVDPIPARVAFEVDGTAPILSLLAPAFNAVVRDTVAITGSITESHPAHFSLRVRPATADSAPWETLASGFAPLSDTLAVLITNDRSDGSYELSFEAVDHLGLSSNVVSRIRIDNVAPSASQVSPVDIEQYSAGDVFSEDLLARAYFPPGSFNTRAHVELDALGTDSLASAGIPHFTALRGYSLRWGAITLMPGKVGILDLSTEGLSGGPPWIMETRTVDGNVVRLGGSVDGDRVSVPLTASGIFYVGVEDSVQGSPGTSLALSLSPRVFRLGGRAALSGSSRDLAIAFGLAQPARVTLAVFNRAGRRVRLLTENEDMPQGDHVVRWDGRDEDGKLANDGLYMISAEFGGNRRVLPFAVVR